MRVRYLYSACIEIRTADAKILTDPWFSDDAYDGSWYQFPKLKNAVDVVGDVDLIYISHIHPDHYDPKFLAKYFKKYGVKKVLIPNFPNNYLLKKAKFDGFDFTPTESLKIGSTNIRILPNVIPSKADIDSALLVYDGSHSMLNLNDCLWNDYHVRQIQAAIRENRLRLDLLAVGYTGAGPYPQIYFDLASDRGLLLEEAHKKKESFFARYRKYCDAFPATFHLPFAGKYMLGGRLSSLNPYRGVADAVEVLEFDPKALVLSDGGNAFLDLNKGRATHVRTRPYSAGDFETHIKEISGYKLDYEKEINIPECKMKLARLVSSAFKNAIKKSECDEDHYFVFHVLGRKKSIVNIFYMNVNKNSPAYGVGKVNEPGGATVSNVFIDHRLFFGLLTGVYHWDNSQIGSQYSVRRIPSSGFNRKAENFLNFLTVC